MPEERQQSKAPALSFIIPTLNEEKDLPQTLDSIRLYVPGTLPHEVIVVDNGSVDGTVDVARAKGAIIISRPSATIGALRNAGAARSRGTILVFLDADVELTSDWSRNIQHVHIELASDPWQVTGSRCDVPSDAAWLESCWFRSMDHKRDNYVNSGHLVVARTLFDRLGGFDESLSTGEDYAFSKTAANAGASIRPRQTLRVVHRGYPHTVAQFMRREMWHGEGDCQSLGRVLQSKVAATAILFVATTVLSIFCLASSHRVFGAATVFLLLVATLALAARHGARTFKCLIVVGFLYWIYFLSRFLSCFSAAIRRHGGTPLGS